jgi:hypothetical protein
MRRCSGRLPWIQRFLQYRRVKGRVRRDSIETRNRVGAERIEEGEISSDDSSGSGEERRRHDHWCATKAKREVLMVRFEGRTEEGKWGTAASGGAPFKRRRGKRRKGGWGSMA